MAGRQARPVKKYSRHRQAWKDAGLTWAGQANKKSACLDLWCLFSSYVKREREKIDEILFFSLFFVFLLNIDHCEKYLK
jgi:hypothetical protein